MVTLKEIARAVGVSTATVSRVLNFDSSLSVAPHKRQAIIETAEAMGTDIIVMGTHGRGGVAHFIMGSVAEHVVRTALCPVFTVRDTARAADLVAERQRASMRVSA